MNTRETKILKIAKNFYTMSTVDNMDVDKIKEELHMIGEKIK